MKRLQLPLTAFALFFACVNLLATEQVILNQNFQNWTASNAVATETELAGITLYGDPIVYKWMNCAVMPAYVAKSDNGVTTPGAIQTNKVDPASQYFIVSGLPNVTKVTFKHSYTGGTRGCIISAKGDGDADWVVLLNANTTAAGGQSNTFDINKTNVSLRFQGNMASQNAYLHDLIVYGNTSEVIPLLNASNYANGDVIPCPAGSLVLTFSENVTRGTGNITLGDQIIPAENIQIQGATVTINYSGLETDASYVFNVPAGAFINSESKPTASSYTVTYKTPDTVSPSLTKMSVSSGAVLPVSGFISLLMSENCKAGAATISLGSKTITAAVSASNANLLYINYSGLAYDTDYTVTIPQNAITDLTGNSYGGTSFTFRTETDAKGAHLMSFTPDAVSVPATASGTVTQTVNNYSIEFGAVANAGARSASPYTYAFKTNYVLLPELPSVGELSFYIQSGGGLTPQEYYIQKLASDGTTWNTIETIILGNNDKNTVKSAAAQSSVPTRLRLMYGGAQLWFYNLDVSAFLANTPVDDGQNPTVSSANPAAGATDVVINGSLKLVFSENVSLGSGDILLDGKVLTPSVVGKNVSLPYSNLRYATNYTLTIPAGKFRDAFNNPCAAFSLNFTTKAKPAVTSRLFNFVVAKDGSGNGTSIQSAFNSVPLNNTDPYLIFVKDGIYEEYPSLTETKNNVSLIGQSQAGVVITGDRRSGVGGYSTSTCQTVEILADNFYCENMTMQNTAGVNAGQAVALKVYADKAVFKNVKLIGYQDTHLTSNTGTDRQYYLNCDIRGSVDFIFGNGACYFDNCLLYLQDRTTANVIVAPATATTNAYGYVFNNCTIDGAGSQDGIYNLGRPWQNAPRAVYLNTKMNILPSAGGWISMSTIPALFAEYNSLNASGYPVALTGRNTAFSYTDGSNNVINGSSPKAVLSSEEAVNYSLSNVLGGSDAWVAGLKTEQTAAVTDISLTNSTLQWTSVDGAVCYLITKDGVFIQQTTATSIQVVDGLYKIVAVSEFGAQSEPAGYLVQGISAVRQIDGNNPVFLKSTMVKDELRLLETEKIKSIQLIGLSGRILLSKNSNFDRTSLSVFAPGCYILRVKSDDISLNYRLIKE